MVLSTENKLLHKYYITDYAACEANIRTDSDN